MKEVKLAFIGFGNVGKAMAHLLERKRTELAQRYGLTFRVTGIATGSHGMAVNTRGISLEEALAVLDNGGTLDSLSQSPPPKDALECIARSQAQVMLENTPVNYASGQPAIDHIRAALMAGMHAVTANKGPVVHAYRELSRLAEKHGVKFYFESAVMDGAPIFSLFREAIPAARLQRFEGVLNSTTNLILSRMESGEPFETAVAYAQSIGIAETDPSGDIDGWDAAVKVAALVTVLMDYPLKPQQVERQGIRQLSLQQVQDALAQGKRWKLVCTAERSADGVRAQVSPQMVSPASPLYLVNGTTSIVQFETDVLGKLSILEEDPGPHTTAYGLLADMLNALKPGL